MSKKKGILGALKAFLQHTLQLVALANGTRVCPGTTGHVCAPTVHPTAPTNPTIGANIFEHLSLGI